MARLATLLGEDHVLWEVTGLCHDLDFEATADDRGRHGLLTAEWLEDDLPNVALSAIRSHDHRTGMMSDTALALALKLADAVAVGELDIGRDAMLEALSAASPIDRLDEALSARPYLPQLIIQPAVELSIPCWRLQQYAGPLQSNDRFEDHSPLSQKFEIGRRQPAPKGGEQTDRSAEFANQSCRLPIILGMVMNASYWGDLGGCPWLTSYFCTVLPAAENQRSLESCRPK